jgi:RES domain-containing protein
MQHGFAYRLEPMTLCSYDLDVDDIVDLSTEDSRQDAGVALDELNCPWAQIVSNGGTPPSWTLATRLISGGTAGIIVPSFAMGATADHSNVVLWRRGPDLSHKVDVFDPSGKLPKNMLSWT